ncbi:MAG: NADH-quinone oxidoreductase subunit H [Candidatus Omnitrophica bacterium]|nr:NADH-quinone oxidoreductase subunit H [Candidatus Omnitrophota bacterium]
MTVLAYIFAFLVFPGLLFSGCMGLLVGWVDRKVTARLQWRVGPPWYQNFLDLAKLALYKETLIPKGASAALFLGMPALGLAAATLVSTIVLITNGVSGAGFIGDVIVVVYLLLIPPIALMIGGFASSNSLASLGASREMKLMISYELPFILALAAVIAKSGYAIRFGDIIAYQRIHGDIFMSWSGCISFFTMLLCMQAKLGFIPFDMPEAETEIISGPYIEYSGKALAIFKLTKAVLLFAIPVLLITLYCGGIKLSLDGLPDCKGFPIWQAGLIKGVIEYVIILVLIVVIKNTNPRVRIDQAMKFFWGIVTVSASLAVILALIGL